MTRSSEDDLDYLIGDGPTVYTNEDIYRQLQEQNHQIIETNRYLASISGGISILVYVVGVTAVSFAITNIRSWF